MPIPAFSIEGVLPPYVGPHGPGGSAEDMSPYAVSAVETVTTLRATDERKAILRGWLKHRAALRAIGFDRGFQWLDGSFVGDKQPKDLHVVAFLHRPAGALDRHALSALLAANPDLFLRHQVKAAFRLDFFAIDLNGSADGIVNLTRYCLGLFSHRRGDELWKGLLQVRLDDPADDIAASAVLGPGPAEAGGGAVTP
jgi:hypothetical protein